MFKSSLKSTAVPSASQRLWQKVGSATMQRFSGKCNCYRFCFEPQGLKWKDSSCVMWHEVKHCYTMICACHPMLSWVHVPSMSALLKHLQIGNLKTMFRWKKGNLIPCRDLCISGLSRPCSLQEILLIILQRKLQCFKNEHCISGDLLHILMGCDFWKYQKATKKQKFRDFCLDHPLPKA